MQMPVIVGVIVAVILLISFSGWFYNLVQGWREFVLDDLYFWYRIGAATIFSIIIMTMTFFGMAYAYDCPGLSSEAKTSLADKLNCPTFNKIKTGAEDLFKKQPAKPAPVQDNSWESQTQEI